MISKWKLKVRLCELQSKAANKAIDLINSYEGDTLLDGDVEEVRWEISKKYYEDHIQLSDEEVEVYEVLDKFLYEATKRYIYSLTH